MTSLEYDVDSMGGLMPQILALTAPPGSRDPNRTQGNSSAGPGREGLAAHPYFRRPGRGHNHDSCDACGEGGDLICCDVCPASFHLTCHDPPLEEEEIPIGQWACHQCRVSGPDDDRTSVSSGKSNKSSKGVKRKDKEEDKPTSSTSASGKSEGSEKNDKRVCAGGREFEISDSPLFTLIKAAATVNPKQFTLPYEMTLPVCFPGEPKNSGKNNGNRRGAQKKKSHELDNGLVPLPAKLCFQCNKSCRIGPLVPCDYCPLFFHLDCLDPPLTTPPTGKWMCPNHPEHFMDSTILTSHSLSERVKLWDKFNPPLDQDTVRLGFLQRCHRQNPPFRYKVKRALRSRIRVPQAVRDQYREPPDLLPHHGPPQHLLPPVVDPDLGSSTVATPSLNTATATATTTPASSSACSGESWRDVEIKEEPPESSDLAQESKEAVEAEIKVEDRKNGEEDRKRPSKEEMDEWLAGLLCLQASIVKHMANNSSSNSPNKTPEKQRELNGPPTIGNSMDTSPPLERPGCMNGDITSHDLNSKNSKFSDNRRKQQAVINSSFQPPPTYLPAKKGILKNQKGKTVTSAGVKTPRQRKQTASEILSETLTNLASSLQNSITNKQGEVTLSQLERSVVEVLAWQRLEELLCPPKPSPGPVTTAPLPARALLCPLVQDSHLQDWAVKSPTPSYCTQPVAMTYRIIHIGKGSHNHVDLAAYGHCNYVSQEHAAIFYDENTGHYELLNYSPHGTCVDGVQYWYDQSEKTVNHAPPPPLLQQVRAIINHRRGQQSDKLPKEAMTDTPGQTLTRCDCKLGKTKVGGGRGTPSPSSGGWEGGAVLHHGSHLRFGCLQFVFSIVEEASKADWVETTLSIYDKFFKQEEEEEEEEVKEEEEEEGDEDKKTKKEEKNSKS